MIIHEKDIDYQKDAKKYVLNMLKVSKKGGKWTLHIKKTKSCYWSNNFSRYADFDTYEEVERCGEPFRKCKNCFGND